MQNNATLEERLNALLEPEVLSGDNQYAEPSTPLLHLLIDASRYLCQQCDSLQDAKRYTELRELPPVLHFSLLRFVYDIATMERKKSKQIILFPTFIDMDRFLGPAETRRPRGKRLAKDSKNLYELRGVLLHKGASAYHGHYEAQVFDEQSVFRSDLTLGDVSHVLSDRNQSWYQFNDEEVTKINSLVPKLDVAKKSGRGVKDTKK